MAFISRRRVMPLAFQPSARREKLSLGDKGLNVRLRFQEDGVFICLVQTHFATLTTVSIPSI